MISALFGLILLSAVYPAEVLGCIDGDTCDVRLDLGLGVHLQSRLRLCDIDAPEVRGEEKFAGIIVRDTLLDWISRAEHIAVGVPGKSKDKFGRLLGWIFADGVNLNNRLVTEELAKPYLVCR